ncbi:helix-turn-helix domain-containing protein [Nocardia neocaledoniensis]|uniref:helix-turn-helix domain-containing protein n=1 Tax=Nocardia neocaledoniensis TaxID=236511 RepID=UPI002456393E|nr:helix-turn-helix transcriptional regulator [Nocardia neocaledoniensis]
MSDQSVFWADLAEDLDDPEFLREFVLEAVRIKTVDSIINALDQARTESAMTKAELARAMSTEPSTIRRLLSSPKNPTLRTVTEAAAALGFRLTLERLDEPGRDLLTAALTSGRARDLAGLEAAVGQFDRAHC